MPTIYSQVIASTDTGISDVDSGGGNSSPPSTLITSGTTNTVSVTTNVFIGWNSATASNKEQTIPAPTTKDQQITIKDVYGSASPFRIRITPVSGTIDGETYMDIDNNKASLTLQADGTSNWMVK